MQVGRVADQWGQSEESGARAFAIEKASTVHETLVGGGGGSGSGGEAARGEKVS